jgi:hypothetical protein
MATDPHPLAGWARARQLFAQVRIDTDGPSESLCFLDQAGACCWQLHRLPDSDFLAWDKLLAQLPLAVDTSPSRPPRPLVRCAMPRWQCCPMRLHALHDTAPMGLAASQPPLSTLGQVCALRLVRDACRRLEES